MSDVQVSLVTPTAQVLRTQAHRVSVPTQNGELTLMHGHAELLASLSAGVMVAEAIDGSRLEYFVVDGFVEASAKRVLVLAERADPLASLDRERALQSLADAESRLKKTRLDTAEHAIQEKRRRRAQSRLVAIAAREKNAERA